MAIYIGRFSREEKAQVELSEKKQQEGMQAWGDWVEKYSGSIVDIGAPLGNAKRVSPDGIADHVNSLTGYVVVEAESLESAAAMFQDHPHFNIYPGDSVEIIECMEIPQN